MNRFLIAAGNGETFDTNSNVQEALEKLGLPGLFQLLPGMEVALMPHQVIGVAWMVKKENDKHFRGCLLADDMGLGKVSFSVLLILSTANYFMIFT